jgi:hypothetical protein
MKKASQSDHIIFILLLGEFFHSKIHTFNPTKFPRVFKEVFPSEYIKSDYIQGFKEARSDRYVKSGLTQLCRELTEEEKYSKPTAFAKMFCFDVFIYMNRTELYS